MKKNIILGILLAGLAILGGGITNNELPEQEYKKNENINLAIYLNEERIENIPSKDSGYLFDEESSFCTNEASVLWDYDSWSPIIKNINNFPTRCTLVFRDFYRVKIYDNEESFAYEIPLNESLVSFNNNTSHNLLSCNNDVYGWEENNAITINNITSDVSCTYYDNSLDALANLDDSNNFFLYLKDESLTTNFVVQTGKNLIVNLNEHTFTINTGEENFALINYGNTTIKNGVFQGRIATYLMMELDDVTISHEGNTISPYENSTLKIYNSKIYSNSQMDASTIWMHSANLEVYNSYIEGPYAIGGEGKNILIDSTELVGNIYSALQVNMGFSANVIIQNNSNITGNINAISMADGTLTLGDNVNDVLTIRGDTGINVGYGTNSFDVNYNAGDIYGPIELHTKGIIKVIDGKTMTSKEENGILHTYLE